MKTKSELVNNWLLKADNDLKSAEHELTFEDAVTETICFHSQQTAEKYLKAYLIHLEIPFKKTHEIGELITKCELKDSEIGSLKEEADTLTDYAVTVRYPDDYYVPPLSEAQEAYELAKKIKDYVLNKIKESSPNGEEDAEKEPEEGE